MIYFSSDTHFNHKLMMEKRPFDTIFDMNRALIDNWNSTVGDQDEVYFLGDWCMGNPKWVVDILWKLKGKIYHVKGNHDKDNAIRKYADRLEWTKMYHELNYRHEDNNYHFVMMHFPIEYWNRKHYGSIHVCGHSHNTEQNHPYRRYDVGVDGNDFKPVSIVDIIEWAKDRPTGPYHH